MGSLTRLDHAESSLDGVFAWYSTTIHNPDDDLDRMIAEMGRIVRPGGCVLIAFQVGSGRRRVGRGYAARGYDVVLHRYHRTVPQMSDVLRRHGLAVVTALERAPVAGETEPQAVVVASRPAGLVTAERWSRERRQQDPTLVLVNRCLQEGVPSAGT